ncbi:diacylglycerol acyltransferase type 2A [Mycotypha africana]|uniref:diacylglycerol acyltransferase type 2A n=1 Tax=Mycotypha africana TaxID=64632 RepID=UPI0023008500|nr:diacylglycerol acyltransferase type 2A [Mycotypha africana]KAI8975203.1 diacylglycerol acyltransferase type 2A [Mycotypha africana]
MTDNTLKSNLKADDKNKILEKANRIKEDIKENLPTVRWAPLTGIPFERRIQTAAILVWVFLLGNCLTLFFGTLIFPFLWPFHIAYAFWAWWYDKDTPENGVGRRSEWFRRLPWWNYFVNYFPVKLVKTAHLDPSRKYIFGYHPHGIISLGAVANFGTEATGFSEMFPGITPSLLTLLPNFQVPLYREIILAMGIASVSRPSCERILSKGGPGRAIVIVIGGASESLNAKPGTVDLILKKRLGFIKLACREGADIVPTFSFGENDLYEQVDNSKGSWLWNLQKKMQRMVGFTVPLFHARGIFNYNVGILPYRHEVVTIVGRPISVPKLKEGQKEPTKEQVLQIQEEYVKELEHIYHAYKDEYAKDRQQELRIVG